MLSEQESKILKNKRQLNVQEQNDLDRYYLYLEANYWRQNDIPFALNTFFIEKGIDLPTSIIVNYEQDYPGLPTDVGIILTKDKEFYEFAIDLNPQRTKILDIDAFKNISDSFEVNANLKGKGKSKGFLAIEVLEYLNNEHFQKSDSIRVKTKIN